MSVCINVFYIRYFLSNSRCMVCVHYGCCSFHRKGTSIYTWDDTCAPCKTCNVYKRLSYVTESIILTKNINKLCIPTDYLWPVYHVKKGCTCYNGTFPKGCIFILYNKNKHQSITYRLTWMYFLRLHVYYVFVYILHVISLL